MTGAEVGIMVLCGAFGFGGIWYVLGLLGPKSSPAASQAQPNSTVPRPQRREWFDVLNVPEGADWPTIKAAYLREISRYHPDKFESLDPEFVDIASRRAKAINDAFATARKLRGKA